ncbi:hypothetical protein LTS08_008150 [Lithohypha guttulata]|nr:hypothetical protein LTS08_008150 [Lithohypha guttulata]
MAQPPDMEPQPMRELPELPVVTPDRKEMRLQSRRHAMTIKFSKTTSFDATQPGNTVVTLRNQYKPVRPNPIDLPPGPASQADKTVPQEKDQSFNFRLKNNKLYVGEGVNAIARCFIEYDLRDFRVLKMNNIDENWEESADFTLTFVFHNDQQRFQLQYETVKARHTNLQEKNTPAYCHNYTQMGALLGNPEADDEEDDVQFYARTPAIDKCRAVQIVIKDYANIQAQNRFNPAVCKAIIEQQDVEGADERPERYYNLVRKGIAAESDASMLRLNALKKQKGDIRASVVRMPGFEDRYALKFGLKPGSTAWSVPDQSQALIFPDPNTPFFGRYQPAPIPGQRPGQESWRGLTYFKDSAVHCAISNPIDLPQLEELSDLADNGTYITNFELQLDENDDESLIGRQNMALHHLVMVMKHQQGILSEEHRDPEVKLNYHQNLPNLFLHGVKDREFTQSITIDSSKVQKHVFQNPDWQFSDGNHQAVIKEICEGNKARYIIQGPPATGKTTMVAKIVAILKCYATLDGTIVVAAHTNEAVRVACARTLAVIGNMLKNSNPEKLVCLAIGDKMLEYWRMMSKGLDPMIEKATIGAHLERLASEQPQKYLSFRMGRNSIKRHGRLQDMDQKDMQRYGEQYVDLVEKLKNQDIIWFGTLATFHLEHQIFGIRSKGQNQTERSGLKTAVLVVDEASQAADPFLAMTILTLNPRNLILAGDHKQLGPFSETEQARRAWETSIFEKLMKRSANRMLSIQYRTNKRLYAGTNKHYNNNVRTYDSVEDRTLGQQILTAIKRISYKGEGQNTETHLSNVVHIFDIKGTVQNQTSSGTFSNPREWAVMRDFIVALRQAGVPYDKIMALTGYQGTYDDMKAGSLDMPGLRVAKIDSAQGDEAEVVVFSMTRRGKSLGFLRTLRRQNVATSRAREAAFYFVDLDLIRDEYGARAWQMWYNGLFSANGLPLTHTIKGPVKFFVQGKEVTPQDANKAPKMPTNFNEPTATPLPLPHSRSTSPARAPVSQSNMPTREKATSQASSAGDGARSRAGSTNQPQTPSHSRTTSLNQPPWGSPKTPSHSRTASFNQPAVSSAGNTPSQVRSISDSRLSTPVMSPQIGAKSPKTSGQHGRTSSVSSQLGQPLPPPMPSFDPQGLVQQAATMVSSGPPDWKLVRENCKVSAVTRLAQLKADLPKYSLESQKHFRTVEEYLNKLDKESQKFRNHFDAIKEYADYARELVKRPEWKAVRLNEDQAAIKCKNVIMDRRVTEAVMLRVVNENNEELCKKAIDICEEVLKPSQGTGSN